MNAPMLFNLFIDTVVRCLIPVLKQSGVRFVYKFDGQLRECKSRNMQDIAWVLMYADDIAIFTETESQMQAALDLVDVTFAQWGLEVSLKKSKVMNVGQTNLAASFCISRGELEVVDAFKYLGSIASSDASMQKEIAQRLSNAGLAYYKLSKLWKDPHLARSTKISVYKSVVLASLLYGGETWAWSQVAIRPLATFHMRCLRKLCGVTRWHKISNTDILSRCSMESVDTLLRFRRLRWLGHIARMDDERIPITVWESFEL